MAHNILNLLFINNKNRIFLIFIVYKEGKLQQNCDCFVFKQKCLPQIGKHFFMFYLRQNLMT